MSCAQFRRKPSDHTKNVRYPQDHFALKDVEKIGRSVRADVRKCVSAQSGVAFVPVVPCFPEH